MALGLLAHLETDRDDWVLALNFVQDPEMWF